MRSLGRVEHLAAGAFGAPGKRTFFLEVGSAHEREWFILEKEQVAALAAHGLELLGEASGTVPEPLSGPLPLRAPAGEPTFRVGEIGLGAEAGELLVLLSPDEDGEPVAFSVDAPLFATMARRALAVAAAGRPKCRLCGLPLDPDGHACPGGNGDRHRR